MEEYRKEEEQEEMKTRLLCPVCQRGFLQKDNVEFVRCPTCNMQLLVKLSLEHVGHVLHTNVNEHAANCGYTPQFTVIREPNGNDGLFIFCGQCSTFAQIC